jgi:integrase
MPKLKFTTASITHLTTDTAQAEYFDSMLPGFGIRVSRRGTKTYFCMVRELAAGGWKKRRVNIGRHGELNPDTEKPLTLADARQRAREIMAAASEGRGVDSIAYQTPLSQRLEQSAHTFKSEQDQFLAEYRGRGRKRPAQATLDEYRRCLTNTSFAPWNDLPVSQISEDHVTEALQRIVDRGHEARSIKVHTVLRLYFNWLKQKKLIKSSPAEAVERPAAVQSRKRILTDDELATIWQFAGDGVYADIVRIMLLSGQRRQEVAGMRWSEIDLVKKRWDIPGERTKNGLPHIVPLSEPLMRLIERQQAKQQALGIYSDLVLTVGGTGLFNGWSKSKTRLDKRVSFADWQLRDLRRTLVTQCNERGHEPHVIEAIVNHTSGSAKRGVAGVYNRAAYLAQREVTLNDWANHIMKITGNGKKAVLTS